MTFPMAPSPGRRQVDMVPDHCPPAGVVPPHWAVTAEDERHPQRPGRWLGATAGRALAPPRAGVYFRQADGSPHPGRTVAGVRFPVRRVPAVLAPVPAVLAPVPVRG